MKANRRGFDNDIWHPYGKPSSADTKGKRIRKKMSSKVFSVAKSSHFSINTNICRNVSVKNKARVNVGIGRTERSEIENLKC